LGLVALPGEKFQWKGESIMSKPEEHLEEFRRHLAADGKANKTIASYTGDVREFLEWLAQRGAAFDGQLQRFQVTAYRRHIAGAGYKTNTINKKINSLRCFNLFLVESGRTTEIAVHPKKDRAKVAAGSERQVEVFTDAEVERILLHAADRGRCTARDGLVMAMLLYTGLRVSELVTVRLSDIDLFALSLTVRGKGGKVREVPLKPEVINAIKEYLETERKKSPHRDSQYLLLTQRSGRMDRDTVNKILKKHGRALGVAMHPHKFRHTFCTRLVKKGVPLTTVAMLAGHASVQTTARFYVNTSREEKRRAVELL